MLREALGLLESKGEKGFFSTLVGSLAEALYRQGRLKEAEEATRAGEQTASTDDFASQVGWRGVRAEVLAVRGELDRAERLAREGVAIAEPGDYIDLRGDMWMDLAEVLTVRGSTDARDALEQALALYERKGNLVSAARARGRLAELGV